MLNGTNLTLKSDVDQDTYMFGLHERSLTLISMHHLQVHTNQNIKKRSNKDKDSTVHTTEYRSKRDPTVNPRWA